MTCVDMLHPAKGAEHQNMKKPEKKRRNRRERDRFRTEIAKQVDTWMTSSPVTSKFLLPSKTSLDQGFKRQKKYRLGELVNNSNEASEEPRPKTETELNVNESSMFMGKFTPDMNAFIGSSIYHQKPTEPKYNLVTGFRKQYKVSKSPNESPRRRKNSRYLCHRSVHDEIEFQKRYRRLFDLNKHLQFVNSNYLTGKNINDHLPPIHHKDKSGATAHFGMFEINSVQRHNDPGPLNDDYSEFDSDTSGDLNPYESRQLNSRASSVNFSRYKKLPDIPVGKETPSSPNSVHSGIDELTQFQRLPDNHHRKQLSDSNISQKDTMESRLREEAFGTCDDSGIGERTVTQTTQASECEPYPEMKISVNIKFKTEMNKDIDNTGQTADNSDGLFREFDGYYKHPNASVDDAVNTVTTCLPKLNVRDSGHPQRTSIRRISE